MARATARLNAAVAKRDRKAERKYQEQCHQDHCEWCRAYGHPTPRFGQLYFF